MGASLTEIALELKNNNKRIQLIYAFNGTGKTRLSKEFSQLLNHSGQETEEGQPIPPKVLYFNAYTEDLFYWNNTETKLKIWPNEFTNLALTFLRDQGQDGRIASKFQEYTNRHITPRFSEDFSEVTFSLEYGDDQGIDAIKISKGEESNFIWCMFYTYIEQIIEVLNEPEPENRTTDKFNHLEYVFIDDPVSSLDDNHLIELAVDVARLVINSESDLKFIITTHNPLFYNVLFNEFNRVKRTKKLILNKRDDGTYSLHEQTTDSPFSYHLTLISELNTAIQSGNIKKYHFNMVRNILEKTSTFLGYEHWENLLPEQDRQAYYKRIINLCSHSKHHGEELSLLHENDKRVLTFLCHKVLTNYGFKFDHVSQ